MITLTGALAVYGSVVATAGFSWQVFSFQVRRRDEETARQKEEAARRGILRIDVDAGFRPVKVYVYNDSDFAIGVDSLMAICFIPPTVGGRAVLVFSGDGGTKGIPRQVPAHGREVITVPDPPIDAEIDRMPTRPTQILIAASVKSTTGADFTGSAMLYVPVA